jgi:nucleoside-diphosphate-sugar epimerase
MKIAILGANGFLGKLITSHLFLSGHDVLPVTRKTVNLVLLREVENWIANEKPEVIINCAIAGGGLSVHDRNFDDVRNNLNIFLNFYSCSYMIPRFINIGSGAEFDLENNIENAHEYEIIDRNPTESYAFSKNVISRLCREKGSFYTLRLFGCFDKSEPDFRLFKKFSLDPNFELMNRKFDYISFRDFCKILDHYIDLKNNSPPRDINCVYQEKLYLSQILDKFNRGPVRVIGTNPLNYTGSGELLAALPITLDGLDQGIKDYGSI